MRFYALSSIGILLLAGCGQRENPRTGPSHATAGTAAGVFRDVAAQAGIDFRWGHDGRSPLDIRETIGHGCSFLDYDQDGLLDIILVGERTCALYRNLGGGRFQDASRDSGLTIEGDLCGVAIGDYDNDGYPDVYITGYGRCALYHNRAARATPAFEEVTATAGVGALGPYDFVTVAAFVDLDGDGKLDLIAGRYIKFTPASPRFCKYNGVETTCGVVTYDPAPSVVYRNDGSGKFTDVTKAWGFDALHGRCLGLAICASDTGKGVMVYAANDEMPCDLMVRHEGRYVNIGSASGTAFSRDGMRQAGMGADWGDFNNDSRIDLVVATFQNEPKSLYMCDSPERFSEVGGPLGTHFGTMPYVAWTAKFIDYDNDGWQDLFVTNGHVQENIAKVDPSRSYPQPLQLLHNEQGQRFRLASEEARQSFGTPIVGRGASIGDFDNDGRQDVLLVNEEGRALLLHNERAEVGHWLGIRLTGKQSNRDGIGARVSVTAGGKTYVRDQQLCGGYVSGQDPRLHFGLGESSKVDRIEVRWTNGYRDVVQYPDPRLQADSYITIVEGEK